MKKSKYISFLAILITALILILATVVRYGSRKEQILAKVDGRIVTLTEFNDRISRLPVQYQEAISRERFLDDFIVELLVCKEAISLGIDKQKDTRETLEEAERKILMAKFIEEEIEKKVKAKEAELRNYYEEYKDRFVVPEKIRASHILVKTEEKAKEILDKLNSGTNFEELANAESIDITNRRGGDIGYFTRGQLIPEFEEACMKLKVGQISPIVKTTFGYHIIKVTDTKPTYIKDFKEIEEEIEAKVTSLKRREKFNRIVQDLKNKASIKINHDLLKDEDKEKE